MRTLLCFTLLSVLGSFGHAQVIQGTWPEEGGPITVFPVDAPISIMGIDFTDVSGNNQLNRVGDDPSPFTLFVSPFDQANSVDRVTIGTLGIVVEIDGPTTFNSITVSASAEACDILATTGTGGGPHPLSTACVPEPGGGFLFGLGALGYLSIRRSRKN